jgi:hypothetical protein
MRFRPGAEAPPDRVGRLTDSPFSDGRKLAASTARETCRGATQDRRGERLSRLLPSGIGEAAMTEKDLQRRNARLRRKIYGALKNRPELEAVINNIALKEPANASLEQVQANLQERAWAIVEAESELDGYFDD